MDIIRNAALQWRNKLSTFNTKNPVLRKTTNFNEARNIGVLIYVTDENDFAVLESFVNKLKSKNKQVKVLAYHSLPVDIKHSLKFNNFFNKEEITLSGEIKSAEALDFINTKFDYLYCLSTTSAEVVDNLMLRSKALCRVGKHLPGKEKLFELMFSSNENNLAVLSEQLLHYTSIINNNDN